LYTVKVRVRILKKIATVYYICIYVYLQIFKVDFYGQYGNVQGT